MKEGRIKNLLKRTKGKNKEVLFHHRLSTSTADVPNACHPFSTKDHWENNYVGVHNGVIYNDNELEKEHKALGINYVSRQKTGEFNDSEALIYDIARYLEGETTELTAEGSIAFIIVKRDKDGKPVNLFFGHNAGNPLVMKKTKNSLTISSEGDGVECEKNTLYSYDYETGTIRERYMYIPYYKMGFSSGNSSYSYSNYYDGYTNDRTGESLQAENEYYKTATSEAYDIINAGGFVGRTGTKSVVKNQILDGARGDYETAAIQALVELEEVVNEESRINSATYGVEHDNSYQDLSDYWYFLHAYRQMMEEIADELEQSSVVSTIIKNNAIVKDEVEVLSDGTKVFPSGIQVSPEEQSLLPMGLS